jgi:hypothetical protein
MYMYIIATNFNRSGVCKWDHSKATDSHNMFTGAGMAKCAWS